MKESIPEKTLKKLADTLDGKLHYDNISRIIYSTDASVYREKPLAVAVPQNKEDIKKIIQFARQHKTSIIPRGGGTSLAGQVVGSGIVVDVSKNLNKIIELNEKEKWVRVEPGIVLDELNIFLKPYGLFFAPETSTSNRCVIGGMVGNNSCGAHSVIYGSTREHTLEIKAFLSDGSEAVFKEVSKNEFLEKGKENSLEGKLYENINAILSKAENQAEIRKNFPDPTNPRKNTGYALDILLETEPFSDTAEKFNFCKLLAGSEGTLAFITEIKLNLLPLPPKNKALICAHFNTLEDALHANLIALKYKPGAVELMDDVIMNCTKNHIAQRKNRFFIQGNPKAILIIEFARESMQEIEQIRNEMEKEMRDKHLAYHFPLLTGENIAKVWSLRKAGLGLLSNIKGDKKQVTLIEDTSVKVDLLPEYVKEFKQILAKYSLTCVYYAHIGSGELHLRPSLNLKDEADRQIFQQLAKEVALLVKKYRGSLSGEHGDGRLRGEFIPLMIGEKNYALLKNIKQTWDAENIFNVGKIIDTPSILTSMRYEANQKTKDFDTFFSFDESDGIVRAAERCNGAGDCRKSVLIGGTMCPSFMASRNEKHSTRARANTLREFLTRSERKNPFSHEEIYDVLDLCLSCKACKSECPSGVDMAKLKAEFLSHYYENHKPSLRTMLIANFAKLNQLSSKLPRISNFFFTNTFFSAFIKKTIGFAPKRSIPLLSKKNAHQQIKSYRKKQEKTKSSKGEIVLFIDEFTNFNDAHIGLKTYVLLSKLRYKVKLVKHKQSARTYLSKGFLKQAKKIAEANVLLLKKHISPDCPLLGIEPSAILSFRDEYPGLVADELKTDAQYLAKHSFMLDEFLAKEMEKGEIAKTLFTSEKKRIKLHGHCQQKSIASTTATKKILSFPTNYQVEEIPSGCCGMAGAFGYEKEHYELSMKIGELVLFPEVRKTPDNVLVAAPGTSCRHQIKDATGREALHPIEILYDALL
ncbi:MAG: FAD-binding oxidoreductase [Bacteroidia bacterium]|nr:MAG: FAD-binding oxidoreductase [Bacteroidia bacterium]